MIKLVAIFIGGGLGSTLRYSISIWASEYWSALGTLISNTLSSFILGVALSLLSVSTSEPKYFFLFLAVGFCGGFSTFSTFAGEGVQFFSNGHYAQALLHIFANLAFSMLAVLAGMYVTKLVIT